MLAGILAACGHPETHGVPLTSQGVSNLTPVAASALRERAIEVVEQLSANDDPSIRAHAAEAATRVPGRLQAVIDKAVVDPNSGVRGVTAMAIGKAQLKGYDDRLEKLLQDPEPITQVCATYALVRCGVNVDRSPLANWLFNDPSAWVKRQVVDVLGFLGDPSALPMLRAAARERFPTLEPSQLRILQLLLAGAMVRCGDDSQRPVVRAALYPSSPEGLETATLAISLIGELKDREASAQLVALANYKDKTGKQYPPETRLTVAGALASLGMPQGYFVADEYIKNPSPVIRAQCAAVYGVTKGSDNASKLNMLMNDPDPLVRVSAAGAVLRGSSGG